VLQFVFVVRVTGGGCIICAMADIWGPIHAERKALGADLAGLTPEQWATPSLCEGWSVQQVLAHLTSTANMTPPKFLAGFFGAGFNFGKFADKGVQAYSSGSPSETLAAFTAAASNTKCPPGPKVTWVGETLIHADDIRRALGIAHTYDQAAVVQTLDFYKGSNAIIGAKNRIAGLTLKATDADWTTGSGPLVEGPAMSLLMATTGRKSALGELTGDGVAELQKR
jgi:uncharacterized protein (TIGR03083 family)